MVVHAQGTDNGTVFVRNPFRRWAALYRLCKHSYYNMIFFVVYGACVWYGETVSEDKATM